VRNYLLEFLFPKGEGGGVRKDVVNAAMPEVANTVSILEKQIAGNEYLIANQFTLADIMLMPVVHYLSVGPNNEELLSGNSSVRAYVKRLLTRPAAQKVFI
jgi:glutathione S-transferase